MNVRKTTRRMDRVQAPMIPVVGEWIAQHPGTISLGQGVVHYSPPAEVGEAVRATLLDDPHVHGYGLVRGRTELLNEIAGKLSLENGITMNERRSIVCTAGSNMGFMNAVLATADVDDEVMLLSPYYFNHEMAIDIAGCRPVIVPTDSDYQIDLAAIQSAMTPRTRAIVTVSPNNPTGAVYPRDALAAVNQLCKANDVYHISDEAYEYFVFGENPHFSAASLAEAEDHTISLYSLSKAYGMAGWRCGYMVIPAHLETAVKKIQDTILVCPPMASQIAATAALRIGAQWCLERIAGFQQVRDLVLAGLASLGDRCKIPRPEGAFYALLQVKTDQTDLQLVETLIRDFGVAVMPGSTFGVTSGCSLRIAYGALDRETVAEGIGRLTRGLHTLL